MTNKKILREKILNKFRSLSYFCKLTGTPYKKALIVFNSEDEDDSESLKRMEEAYNTIDVDESHGLIRNEDRKAVRLCVVSNFKSYSAFNRKHKGFDSVYLSNLIEGSLTEETEKYRDLIKLLTAKYELDVMIWYRIKKVSKIET